MDESQKFMSRCIGLARLGCGHVAPNPMVGAVLVHEGRIIGEGYHEAFGQAHAEVNCIRSVRDEDIPLISRSELYVSLEPCAHFGKTPPCTDLIIARKIPSVIIGCRDPFEKVNGRGMETLKAAGIRVEYGVLEDECRKLNKRFFVFHLEHRPYIILKWAETGEGRISGPGNKRLLITNEFTNRLVHKWRSEEAALLVGTNTALMDNPELTTRLWPGHSPVRLVIDMHLRLPSSLKLFNGKSKTIIFNEIRHDESGQIIYWQVTSDTSLVHQVMNALYTLSIQSVMVEGGARLIQSFIDEACWDEARVLRNPALNGPGLPAPRITQNRKIEEKKIFGDSIEIFERETTISNS